MSDCRGGGDQKNNTSTRRGLLSSAAAEHMKAWPIRARSVADQRATRKKNKARVTLV